MSTEKNQPIYQALQEEHLQWSNCNTILDDPGRLIRLRWVVGNPQQPLRAVNVSLTAEQAMGIGEALIAHAHEAGGGVILASPADIEPTARSMNGHASP